MDIEQKSYLIRVKFTFKRISVNDNGRSYNSSLVILQPDQMSHKTNEFFMDWTPQDARDHVEKVGIIKTPINSPARFSIRPAGEHSSTHYLHVMSKGVADMMIKRIPIGNYLIIDIRPEEEDTLADQAPDADGNYSTIRGQEGFDNSPKRVS